MLQELIDEVTKESLGIVFPIPGWEGANFLNTDRYHKWLASYIRKHEPAKCLELGRRYGNSLYSMSYHLPSSCILDSYDLNMDGKTVDRPNVNVMEYDGNFSNLDLSQYDFIFVDINGRGEAELRFYNQLVEQGFTGLVAWDDIGTQWCPDEPFWDHIPDHTKLRTDLHGEGGFGFTLHK